MPAGSTTPTRSKTDGDETYFLRLHRHGSRSREGFNACMKDEQDARTRIASQWETFLASDRASCTQNETTGGSPSDVELLTCLQMARDARALPADKTEGSNR